MTFVTIVPCAHVKGAEIKPLSILRQLYLMHAQGTTVTNLGD
jgi:hypothetical protein